MKRVPYIALAVAVILLAGPQSSAQKKDDKADATATKIDITGRYEVVKTVLGGGKVEGTVVIKADGDGYEVIYSYDNGKVVNGLAIRRGDQLAVSWQEASEEKADKGKLVLGVSSYTITVDEKKPKLKGEWLSKNGPGMPFAEEMKYLKALKKE